MISLSIIREQISKIVAEGDVPPPVLAYGVPGSGKTTTGKKIANAINADLKVVQCSRWNSELADEIRSFCEGANGNLDFMFGQERIRMIILDELEQFQSGIEQLRPIMDDYSEKVFFYATTNYVNKIPDGVIDRFISTEIPGEEVSLRQQNLHARLFGKK